MLIGSLWQKAINEKNIFYTAMLIIAFLDLSFDIMCFCHFFWFKSYWLTGSTNWVGMNLLLANRGSMFTMSLASDICAVFLTLERYLAVAKPHFHKKLSENHKKSTNRVVIMCIVLISATRSHFFYEKKVVNGNGSIYFYTATELVSSKYLEALSMTSDVVLPFILLVVMIFLSTSFRLAVMKRQKKKIHVISVAAISSNSHVTGQVTAQVTSRLTSHPPSKMTSQATDHMTSQSQKAAEDLRSILILTLSLDFLFILNQFGYCVYFIAETMLKANQISYESDYSNLAGYVKISRFDYYSAYMSDILEVVSHSFNFLLYICLSKSMRKDFYAFMKMFIKKNINFLK